MLFIIVGPTGSKKTSTACKLSSLLNHCPIINADAFQVYDEMNIGTAKISSKSEYYRLHHLLNIRKPDQEYSVKDYQEDFRKTYDKLKQDNKDVVVCGGTGLYIRAAIYDYQFPQEEGFDDSDLQGLSNDELYSLLVKLDKKASENIHPNNRKRVIRAICIARNQELNKSENIDNQKHEYIYPKEDIKIFFINPNRESLYENINTRVDEMMQNGLVDETKYLLDKYHLSKTASQAIGYKEIISYLNNEMSLEEAIELIKKRSRNYAKRQVTFFKHQFDTIEVSDGDEIIRMIQNER